MFAKTLGLIFLCSASLGFVIENGDIGIKATEFGPQIVDLVNSVAGGLPDSLTLLDLGADIRIDLTELTKNTSVPIRGSMNISQSITAIGLPGVKAINATMVLNGIIPPIPFDINLDLSAVKIAVGYSLDALVANIIPIRGKGLLTLGLDLLTLEVLGSIKIFATPTLKLQDFDFKVQMEKIRLHFEGLLGDEELAKTVSEIFAQIVAEIKLLDIVKNLIPLLKPSIIPPIKAAFDNQNLTLAGLTDLLKPKPVTTLSPLY